ncbi:MAG TPA: LacI family transcriptional regulator [Candidatus Ruthenibacterium merdigallinarum]|nr:LacI family transcriptional regulator [Candidatus Ruthenibacterium merdigallinarum]
MVTIKEIARQSGVSSATVSRVLTNSRPVQPELRERVTEVARQLGYVPNTAARALVKRRTNAIGVVVNNLHDPFFYDLIRGFEAGAMQTDFNVVFCSAMGREIQQKQRYVRYLSNGVVDGIILYGSYDFDEALARELHAAKFPFFLIESSIDGVKTNNFLIDNEGGVYSAVHYLYNRGHRRIAYIAEKLAKRICAERLKGYYRAMQELGLDLPEKQVRYIEEDYRDGYSIMEHFLSYPPEQRPTAVLCYDDAVASYAVRCAMDKGFCVPGDISVMGFDNQTVLPDGYQGPAITSVAQPLYEIGFDSILSLSQILRGERKETITKLYQTHIAEKETVADRKKG